MLGGAYVALSDDPSGIYYNPSGLPFAEQDDVSLNVLLSQLDSEVVFEGAVLGNDFTETSSTRFSGLTGGLAKLGGVTLGYGVFTLDNKNINQNDSFENLSTDGLINFDRIHQETVSYDFFGAGLGIKLGKLGIGFSSFYYSRKIESMDFQLAQFAGETTQTITTKIKTDNTGLLNILGIMFRGRSMSVGMALKKGNNMKDETNFDVQTIGFNPEANEGLPVITSASQQSTIFDERNPTTAQVGFAFFPTKRFLVAFDVLYHFGVEEDANLIDLEDTFNFSLGSEVRIGSFRVAVGAFTNFSMFPEVKEGEINQPTKLDYIGYSGGLTYQAKSFDASVGYVSQTGRGEAQVAQNTPAIQDVTASSNLIFIASKINL